MIYVKTGDLLSVGPSLVPKSSNFALKFYKFVTWKKLIASKLVFYETSSRKHVKTSQIPHEGGCLEI